MNSAMYQLFGDMQMAEQARAKLVAAGIKRQDIEVLALEIEERGHSGSFADTAMHAHDAERDHVGGFADTDMHMHDAQRDHAGGFADTDMHMHDAQRDHVGSFASHLHADDIVRAMEQAGIAKSDAQSLLVQMEQGAALLIVRPKADQAMMVAGMLRS